MPPAKLDDSLKTDLDSVQPRVIGTPVSGRHIVTKIVGVFRWSRFSETDTEVYQAEDIVQHKWPAKMSG